jgi:hypothetical protein
MLGEVFIGLVSLTLRIWMGHVWEWLWHTHRVPWTFFQSPGCSREF